MTAIFEKPFDDERHHLKALFVKSRVMGSRFPKYLLMEELQLTSCHM